MKNINKVIDLKNIKSEVERASHYYYYSSQQKGIDNKTKSFLIESCLPYVKGCDILELGYIDGIWTEPLLKKGFLVDIVEGALKHIKNARRKYSSNVNVNIYNNLFQEFVPIKRYDTILVADVLRYLNDPVKFLKKIKSWLKPKGKLIITVPNSRSFHRRIGTFMNLEPSPTSRNKRDREVGNIRSYDRYELRDVIINAGYTIDDLRGCFLKPLSSDRMKKWDDVLLKAFFLIGKELEDYCWFIYAICGK